MLAVHFLGRIRIEAEDRAEVEPGRVIEGQAVGLGAGEGLFVRIDFSLADRLESNPRQEALPRVHFAVDFKCLMVNVERRVIILAEDPSRRQSLRSRAAAGSARQPRCRRLHRGSAQAG